MSVTVYTLPSCVQCNATKRRMDKLGIEYEVVDLLAAPEELERFKGMGHTTAPIVEAGDEVWSGFRLDKIAGLASK